MPFCRLNGLEVPIESAECSIVEAGGRERAFDGSLLVDRRTTKRVWQLRTGLLSENDADVVRGMILGSGHFFSFDEDGSSSRGLWPTAINSYTLNGDGADTFPVVNAYADGKSISLCPATVNLLSANQRDVEDGSSGFTAVDSAIVGQYSDYFWQGANSLRVISSSSPNSIRGGVHTNDIAVSAATTYVGSVYVMGGWDGVEVRAYLYDSVNAITGNIVSVTVNEEEWTRIPDLTITTGAGSPNIRLYVLEENADDGLVFYCDGFQIEQQDEGLSTAWVDGTRASNEVLAYSVTPFQKLFARDVTINFWFASANSSSSHRQTILRTYDAGPQNGIIISYYDRILVATYHLGTAKNLAYSMTGDRSFNMFTFVMRRAPESGEHNLELYVDGILQDYEDYSALLDSSGLTAFGFGYWNSVYQSPFGSIDGLAVLPYAVPSTLISTWFGDSSLIPRTPIVYLDGDIVSDPVPVETLGQLGPCKFMQAHVSGSWTTNLQQVEFELREF